MWSRSFIFILLLVGPRGDIGLRGPAGDPGPPGPTGASAGGATYTRWGKNACPNNPGTELIYSGIAAGSMASERGGGTNYICLSSNPSFLSHNAGHQQWRGMIYAAKYKTQDSPLSSLDGSSVPCAMCHVTTRGAVVVIPGQISCPSSWTKEYLGYLMASPKQHYRTTFECIDSDSTAITNQVNSSNTTDAAMFYTTEIGTCSGVLCPPYDTEKEITCVVCTK